MGIYDIYVDNDDIDSNTNKLSIYYLPDTALHIAFIIWSNPPIP